MAKQEKRKAPRRFFTSDVLKVLGVMFTVQASLGASLMERVMLGLNDMTLVQAQSMIQDGSASAVALALIFRLGANFAWPIFAFLAVQGYFYTKNTTTYIARLGIFALISEVPYDLAMSGQWFNWGHQNVLFSLFFGVLALTLAEELTRRSKSYLPRVAMLVGGTLWVYLLNSQFGYLMVPAIFAFFYLEDRELPRNLAVAALCLLMLPVTGSLAVTAVMALPLLLALLILHWYNDLAPSITKWLWYGLYPVHLAILAVVCFYLQ